MCLLCLYAFLQYRNPEIVIDGIAPLGMIPRRKRFQKLLYDSRN
jgi:hypothetical protein